MFVFELSVAKVEALASLMDLDGSWEDLGPAEISISSIFQLPISSHDDLAAAAMRDPAKLVLLLRQAQAGGDSPTTLLLRFRPFPFLQHGVG